MGEGWFYIRVWEILGNPFHTFPFLSYPFPHLSVPPAPTPTVLSVVLFLWLNRRSCRISCTNLNNDNMDLYILSLGTLVPEGPWCVFYATRHQVYWGLTQGVLLVLWFDIIHKTYKAHSGASRLTHQYKFIFEIVIPPPFFKVTPPILPTTPFLWEKSQPSIFSIFSKISKNYLPALQRVGGGGVTPFKHFGQKKLHFLASNFLIFL